MRSVAFCGGRAHKFTLVSHHTMQSCACAYSYLHEQRLRAVRVVEEWMHKCASSISTMREEGSVCVEGDREKEAFFTRLYTRRKTAFYFPVDRHPKATKLPYRIKVSYRSKVVVGACFSYSRRSFKSHLHMYTQFTNKT